MGKPGKELAMADTARSVIGLMALPDTPPYVVFCSLPIAGHATDDPLKPINPDTVLVAVTPSAPPE